MTEGLAFPVGMPKNMPNCGIVACAIAANLPYDTVWDTAVKVLGKRKHWKGRTSDFNRAVILRALNVKFVRIGSCFDHKILRFTRWSKEYAERDTKYLVRLPGHIVVYLNGEIIDQFRHIPLEYSHNKNRKVNAVWRIID